VSSMLRSKRYVLPSVLFILILIRQAQLQARTKECQKWQHLALTHDRNAYRNYSRSKPTNGVDPKSVPSTSTNTPTIKIKSTEASPEHEDLQTPGPGWATGVKVETPTKAGKEDSVKGSRDTEDKEWVSPGLGRVM
jgi:hypothetical protein